MTYALAAGVRNECHTKFAGYPSLELFIFIVFSHLDDGVSFVYMLLSIYRYIYTYLYNQVGGRLIQTSGGRRRFY